MYIKEGAEGGGGPSKKCTPRGPPPFKSMENVHGNHLRSEIIAPTCKMKSEIITPTKSNTCTGFFGPYIGYYVVGDIYVPSTLSSRSDFCSPYDLFLALFC
jgi:hypothetical protein